MDIFTSTPLTGGPTVFGLLDNRLLQLIRGDASVCPYPCNNVKPILLKKIPISGFKAAPPEINTLILFPKFLFNSLFKKMFINNLANKLFSLKKTFDFL